MIILSALCVAFEIVMVAYFDGDPLWLIVCLVAFALTVMVQTSRT